MRAAALTSAVVLAAAGAARLQVPLDGADEVLLSVDAAPWQVEVQAHLCIPQHLQLLLLMGLVDVKQWRQKCVALLQHIAICLRCQRLVLPMCLGGVRFIMRRLARWGGRLVRLQQLNAKAGCRQGPVDAVDAGQVLPGPAAGSCQVLLQDPARSCCSAAALASGIGPVGVGWTMQDPPGQEQSWASVCEMECSCSYF